MEDAALRDELMTLLIAGQETSAILLGWAAALLAHNPATQASVGHAKRKLLWAQRSLWRCIIGPGRKGYVLEGMRTHKEVCMPRFSV